MSTEAIIQTHQFNNTAAGGGTNKTHASINLDATQLAANQAKQIMAAQRQVAAGQMVVDVAGETAQQKLMKLLVHNSQGNNGGRVASTQGAHHGMNDQLTTSQTKQRSGGGASSTTRSKAQNSSSMEQRRGSSSRNPQSRGHSTKKNANAGKQTGMMLLTDARELADVANQHMPRVNLSTTNKTTRDVNLNLLAGGPGNFGETTTGSHTQALQYAGGNNSKASKKHQLRSKATAGAAQGQAPQTQAKLSGKQMHHQHQQKEPKALLHDSNLTQTHEYSHHKRMQSLVTDPQFITQMGLGRDNPHQEGAGADSGYPGYQGGVNTKQGTNNKFMMLEETQLQFHGHTTKNNSGNPKLFNRDSADVNKGTAAVTINHNNQTGQHTQIGQSKNVVQLAVSGAGNHHAHSRKQAQGQTRNQVGSNKNAAVVGGGQKMPVATQKGSTGAQKEGQQRKVSQNAAANYAKLEANTTHVAAALSNNGEFGTNGAIIGAIAGGPPALQPRGGQSAPKATKHAQGAINERLAEGAADGNSSYAHLAGAGPGYRGDDASTAAEWMRKMEQEWQNTNQINELITREEKKQMGKEARFAITTKGPLLSLQQPGGNRLEQENKKLQTQDLGSILRRAKEDFANQEAPPEPFYDEEDASVGDNEEEREDCQVEETDPEEMSYPKHEPAYTASSMHKKNSTNTTSQQPQQPSKHDSAQAPPLETTDNLLKGAYLREQKQLHQGKVAQTAVDNAKAVGDSDSQAKKMSGGEEAGVTPAGGQDAAEEAIEYPMTVRQALKLYAKTGKLTDYEKTELLDFKKVYFLGLEAEKIKGKASAKLHNSGYDDENGDYVVVLKDHLYYRFEVLDFLGKGSFGQALKCLDHKTGEIVAVKIIKNKERYQHQAGVELRILQHLQKQDAEDQNNIIQIKDHCYFRNHLIISFELFSINLYEFIKNNNFQGVSLSLIRRFAIQILQSLKFLREEDVIHCDLKPENILLKSPDKSGIKIIDFGSSCFSDQRIYSYIQSRFYRAPEIIIGIPYTTGIDMWSFGCILIELYTGIPIFPGESEMEQLALIMQVFGVPPMKVLENAERRDRFFQEGTNEPLNIFQEADGSLRLPGSRPLVEIIGEQSESFYDFIRRCLAWDPEERITPFQALQHPWILEGLPRRVLIHHQRMLGIDVPSDSEQASIIQHEQPQDLNRQNSNLNNATETDYNEANGHSEYGGNIRDTQHSSMYHDNSMVDNFGANHGTVIFHPSQMVASDKEAPGKANGQPFDVGMADNDYVEEDDEDDDYNQEVLDVHNRSTHQKPENAQLPARVIDNGMANQFRVESQNQKQQRLNEQRKQKAANEANDGSHMDNNKGKSKKQELSKTQPMPAHFLANANKKHKNAAHAGYNSKGMVDNGLVDDDDDEDNDACANLNYQSLEKGQAMLQYPEYAAQLNHMPHGGQPAFVPALDNDQIADFIGVDDLLIADNDQLQDPEIANPKSKTTNMGSLLRQINKSIKKQGGPMKFELETGEEMDAHQMNVMPRAPQSNTAAGSSNRYKLPQSTGLSFGSGPGVQGEGSYLKNHGSMKQQKHHSGQSVQNEAPNTGTGQNTNVSFLMKHRIRQEAGNDGNLNAFKDGNISTSGPSSMTGSRRNSNKNSQVQMGNSDYEPAQAVMQQPSGDTSNNQFSKHQKHGKLQLSMEHHVPQRGPQPGHRHQKMQYGHNMMLNNFLPDSEDIL